MRWPIYLLAFFFVLGCAGSKTKSEKNLDFHAELTRFFSAPNQPQFAKLVRIFHAKPPGEDEFLSVFAFERSLDPQLLQMANQSLSKDPTLTFQTLYFLAYEVPTLTKFHATHEQYLQFLKDHSDRPKSIHKNNLLEVLAGEAAIQQPEALFAALEKLWPGLTPGQRVRIIRGLADFGFNNSSFYVEPTHSHLEFLKLKRSKWIAVTKNHAGRAAIYEFLTGTRLFRLEPSIVPELRQLIENPSEPALHRLRAECAKRSPTEDPPSADDLSAAEIRDAEGHLALGDIYIARGLAMLAERNCLKSGRSGEGPVQWLGSTLICHYPEILVEALADEHTSSRVIKMILDYDEQTRWKTCTAADPQATAASFLQLKLKLLAGVETESPLEDEVVHDILKSYHYQKAELKNDSAAPAQNF